MSTRNLRNRISSRLSSPAIYAEAEQTDDTDGERNGDTDSDVWVEPSVRKLPPSYQDHKGLERVGVLELQQPLGEPPSQKLLQRLKLTYNRPSNRGTPLQNDDGITPSVGSERLQSIDSPADDEALSDASQDEGPIEVVLPPRGRPAKRDADEMRNSAQHPDFSMSPAQSSPRSGLPTAAQKISIQEHLRQDRVSNYMDKAIEEAERNGDLGLLPGLNRVHNKAYEQRELWVVLEAIAHQSPTPEQLKIFKRYIKKGVKKHRRNSAHAGSAISSGNKRHRAKRADEALSPLSPTATGFNANSSSFTSPFRPRSGASNSRHPHLAHPVHLSPSSRRARMDRMNDRSPGKHQSTGTPRHRRSGSQSSTSSLSSARSIPAVYGLDVIEDEGEDQPADERSRSNPKGGHRQADRSDRAPAKLRSSAISDPNSKHPFNGFPDVARLASKKTKKSIRDDPDYDPADIEKRRKKFQAAAAKHNNIEYIDADVDLRREPNHSHQPVPAFAVHFNGPAPPVLHTQPVTAKQDKVVSTRSSGIITVPDKSFPNGTSRKRNYDEMLDDDDDDTDLSDVRTPSPIPHLLYPPPPPGVTRGSRAGTPRVAKHAAVTKARKSARVMISPNKPKNGGITAGISRVGQGRDPTNGNGADSSAEDNDEFCASCGGEGTLLCCDGCSNSLHHSCLEPPLDPDIDVDGEWYCPQCQSRRNKTTENHRGILGKVTSRISNIIPKAFALPFEVRDYFENVRTGDSGEYEEVGQSRTQTGPRMNRAGFFEEPNYKEFRDSKGKLLTCYACNETANGRDLVPCDFCEHRWHLDCLDPPLAVPPRRRIGDKLNSTWRCPLHVEQDLASIGRQAEAAPGDLGRRPRPRKPKNAKAVDICMSRGFKNNGVIDIDLLPDDVPSIKEIEMNGGVFRLPETGIKLDFIDRVKKSWYEDEALGRPQGQKDRLYRPNRSIASHEANALTYKMQEPDFFTGAAAVAIAAQAKANAALRYKSFAEQQAALNLTDLARARTSVQYSGDVLTDLTNQLIRDAPASAENAIQRDEKGQLLELEKLIQRRLRILDGFEPPPIPYISRYKAIQPAPIVPQPHPQPQPQAQAYHNPYQPAQTNGWSGYGMHQGYSMGGQYNSYNHSPVQQHYAHGLQMQSPFQPSSQQMSIQQPYPPHQFSLSPTTPGAAAPNYPSDSGSGSANANANPNAATANASLEASRSPPVQNQHDSQNNGASAATDSNGTDGLDMGMPLNFDTALDPRLFGNGNGNGVAGLTDADVNGDADADADAVADAVADEEDGGNDGDIEMD